jgi:hypothetical protein
MSDLPFPAVFGYLFNAGISLACQNEGNVANFATKFAAKTDAGAIAGRTDLCALALTGLLLLIRP